jgi:AcrR family transcriptional regulator
MGNSGGIIKIPTSRYVFGGEMPQQRSEETRARIMEAAVKKFAGAGYEAASVDDICTEAGVSKGAFYHHFPSKQSVFLALMNDWLSLIDMGMEGFRKGSVPETLVAMTDMLPGVFAAAEDRLPMFLEFWLQASRDEIVWKAIIEPYHHYQEHFATLVEEGVKEGSLKPVDPQVAAQVVLSLAVGLVLQGVLEPRRADWARVAGESMQLLMNGMAKENTGK